jgi:hypothetical protein
MIDRSCSMAIVFACGTANINVPAGRDSASSPPINVPGIRPNDQYLLTSHVLNSDPDSSGHGLFCPFVERLAPDRFSIFIHAFKGGFGHDVTIRVDWAVLRNGHQPG